jgi:hypothetical protein
MGGLASLPTVLPCSDNNVYTKTVNIPQSTTLCASNAALWRETSWQCGTAAMNRVIWFIECLVCRTACSSDCLAAVFVIQFTTKEGSSRLHGP